MAHPVVASFPHFLALLGFVAWIFLGIAGQRYRLLPQTGVIGSKITHALAGCPARPLCISRGFLWPAIPQKIRRRPIRELSGTQLPDELEILVPDTFCLLAVKDDPLNGGASFGGELKRAQMVGDPCF